MSDSLNINKGAIKRDILLYEKQLDQFKSKTAVMFQIRFNTFDVLDRANRGFPTVEDAIRKAKRLKPKRNFDLESIKTRDRHFLQQCLIRLVEDWFSMYFGVRVE